MIEQEDIIINISLKDSKVDVEKLKENIAFEIKKNIVKTCDKGKHKFIPTEDGTLDVQCVKCGIKAMRSQLK